MFLVHLVCLIHMRQVSVVHCEHSCTQLTTYETLFYAAMLRLPRDWSREAKLERVEMVLEGLGLSKCRDTLIGDHMTRGVSGGNANGNAGSGIHTCGTHTCSTHTRAPYEARMCTLE
jgi:hypothetical protein